MLRDNEIINVFDVERVLGDLPIDIIKENIISQIDDPLTFSTNQADQVYDTISEAMEEFGHIDEYKGEIYELKDNFSIFLIQEIDKKFNLGIDIENLADYEIHDVARNCYNFFIVNLRDNLTRFISNYIYSNKLSISEEFGEEYKKRDVTTINMKKLTKNKDDIIILSNTSSIINYVLNLEYQPEEFMALASEDGEYVCGCVTEYVNSFKIAGNFVTDVLNELKFAHNDTIDEIAASIILEIKDSITDDDSNTDFIDEE